MLSCQEAIGSDERLECDLPNSSRRFAISRQKLLCAAAGVVPSSLAISFDSNPAARSVKNRGAWLTQVPDDSFEIQSCIHANRSMTRNSRESRTRWLLPPVPPTEFGRMTTEIAAEDDHQQGRAFTSQRPQRDRGSARPAPLHTPSTQLLDHDRPGSRRSADRPAPRFHGRRIASRPAELCWITFVKCGIDSPRAGIVQSRSLD